jgi:hypothetical protein
MDFGCGLPVYCHSKRFLQDVFHVEVNKYKTQVCSAKCNSGFSVRLYLPPNMEEIAGCVSCRS